MQLSDMTRAERGLLLYLESCAVDHGGLVDTMRMNEEDMDIAKRWNDGFIYFGRVYSKSLKITSGRSYWCELTDRAWELAHAERRARNLRMTEIRKWRKTKENGT